MLKKIFITGGIALAAYVLNSMRKEFDKNVSDYNDLVDKYNDLVQSKNGNHYPDSKERYKKETDILKERRNNYEQQKKKRNLKDCDHT